MRLFNYSVDIPLESTVPPEVLKKIITEGSGAGIYILFHGEKNHTLQWKNFRETLQENSVVFLFLYTEICCRGDNEFVFDENRLNHSEQH